MLPADGLLLLLVADVVGLGRDQVDELGAAVQDQLPRNSYIQKPQLILSYSPKPFLWRR